MSWNYRVPKFAGSPWEQQGAELGGSMPKDMDVPTIGVYCPHETPHDWLLGSFSISPTVAEQRGEMLWGWHREYLTGAGEFIRLSRQRQDSSGTQLIVDDAPANRKEVNAEVAEAQGHIVRQRIPMRCGVCGLARVLRSDRVQEILTTLWKFGIREISLDALGKRVDHAT